MPLRNLLVLFLAAILSLMCHIKADRNRYASTVSEAMDLITFNYLEDVDYRQLYENAMHGMAEGLDPYSSYIGPAEYGRFKEELDQEFGGIGILVDFSPETKRIVVVNPLFDTPASRAGVRAGDVILAIDGKDTATMSYRDAVQLIRGLPGEPVRLTLLHVGEEKPVDLVIQRAIIPIESVLGDARRADGDWSFQLQSDPRIMYVRVINFGENTVDELKQALRGKSMRALILDLRDNAGGLLDAAVGTCEMFLDGGTIVTIRGRDGEVRRTYEADGEPLLPKDVPLVVLVNHFSASASEIVAACLQDHGRAKIAGQRTWGKGTVQNVIPLEAGRAALKLTTASYWRPSGKNIHRLKDAPEEAEWGVRPDPGLEVKLTEEQADAVRQARRRRDIGAGPDDASTKSGGTEKTPQTTPADDAQLRNAVEYLQQRWSAAGTKP
ncbi:MAG TPA: S41 family peptidase [Candidatus Anammoximicrobium sp.]|nr:S41 family peptidase [Candidatus Anammoximicrobium sp.]HPM80152.1 S41 family peptidase [Candidatus Anammoximicrobium sp.]